MEQLSLELNMTSTFQFPVDFDRHSLVSYALKPYVPFCAHIFRSL